MQMIVMSSRFVAYDSLAILKIHRLGLASTSNKGSIISLKNNCTVFGVEFQTMQLIIFVEHLDPLNLSLRLGTAK
jgi:hypothetical protein